jgi:phenylalanyl-tRNA synthetase beta chain
MVFNPSLIDKLCGFSIDHSIAEKSLTNLGFGIEKSDGAHWNVTIPAHRPDITCQADVVSECLRMYGTDKIPETIPNSTGIHRNSDGSVVFLQSAANYFSSHGFFECCTLSLRNMFETEKLFGDGAAVAVRNQLSADQNCFRNSLIPGLLDAMELNVKNGNCDTKFFETGRVVLKIDGKFNECLAIGCIVLATPIERSWKNQQNIDFYDIKELVYPILRNFSQRVPEFDTIKSSNLWQPEYSASCGLLRREKFQCTCGMICINLLKKIDIRQNIFATEIVIHPSIFSRKAEKDAYEAFSQFPRISKDISLIVGADEPASSVENNVARAAKKHAAGGICIESVTIFDIYSGEEIPDGPKNIGLTINYRSDSRTLTDTEVQAAFGEAQLDIEKLYKIRKQA